MNQLITALGLALAHLTTLAQAPNQLVVPALPSSASATAASAPTFARVQVLGSLEPTLDLGCIAGSQVLPTHAPPDLFLAAFRCVMTDQFDRAARLMTIAQAFGQFDVARLTDRTVAAGPTVLARRMVGQVPREKLTALLTATRAAEASAALNAELCADLQRVGPPAYYPRYLVLHGLAAASGQSTPENSLKASFDGPAYWAAYLKGAVRCP
ncbi:hypothetical protein [Pelomonas cellulosilytica]|uniref:Uncharacterized protein n=1 Tax=Pelomonas cellulosilytica TaxID=2906762 RepID=A0ABS8XXV2_9BURK|nr:hypothetical protein [Pelomonas sp. P8]MCE4555601.1 hypothetical protein [Pelomonas sp. P8]